MKAVFIFIFLFGFCSIAYGQEEFIELQHEPVDFKAEGFFIKNVIDGRADKESIGFVQKGIFKKTKVYDSFKHGLETAIYNSYVTSFFSGSFYLNNLSSKLNFSVLMILTLSKSDCP
jgi:hypothetical protein